MLKEHSLDFGGHNPEYVSFLQDFKIRELFFKPLFSFVFMITLNLYLSYLFTGESSLFTDFFL